VTQERPTPTPLRLLHDRILVKRTKAEDKTPGGLFIPDNAKEMPVEAFVIAVGDGACNKDDVRIPLDVKAGDRVLFSKYIGAEVKIHGDDHVILREGDILAVIQTSAGGDPVGQILAEIQPSAGGGPVGQLMRINAQMFEGTIRVLGQQNMDLHRQVTELTAANAKLLSRLEDAHT
jgi:chaperonin GroES